MVNLPFQDHCFLTQFWLLCQSFTNSSYSLEEAHLCLLLSRSFDRVNGRVCVCSSHWAGCQEGVSFVSSYRQRRDKPPHWQADLHRSLTRFRAVCCWEWCTHPRGWGGGCSDLVHTNSHCCGSVPSVRKKLGGPAKKEVSLEKWSWVPVCHFFPLGRHCYIILCLDYSRPLKYSRGTPEMQNP